MFIFIFQPLSCTNSLSTAFCLYFGNKRFLICLLVKLIYQRLQLYISLFFNGYLGKLYLIWKSNLAYTTPFPHTSFYPVLKCIFKHAFMR